MLQEECVFVGRNQVALISPHFYAVELCISQAYYFNLNKSEITSFKS